MKEISDEFFKILLLTIGLGFLMVSLVGISIVFLGIYGKINDIRSKKIKKNIVKSLQYFCDQMNIPVSTSGEYSRPNGNDAIGYINYLSDQDTGKIAGAAIFLRDDIDLAKECMWCTFAHEVGHYISQDVYNDKSESGADMEAYRFINYILSTKERLIMKTCLDIYFRNKEDHPKRNISYPTHIKEKAFIEQMMKEVKEYYEGIRSNN